MTGSYDHYQEAMNLGHTAAWDQDWPAAVSHYQRALEEVPDDAKALVSLGLALYEVGLYEQSLEYYLRAIEIAPDDPLAFEKASQLYDLLGQHEAVSTPGLRASELYLKEGNTAKAVECLVRINRVDIENLPAHSRLALIYERTGRKQQSMTEYLIVASLLQHRGDLESARQAIDRALTLQPNSREAAEALSIIESGLSLPKPIPSRIEVNKITPKPLPTAEIQIEQVDEISELDPVAEAHQRAVLSLANLVFDQQPNQREMDGDEFVTALQNISDEVSAGGFMLQGDPQKAFAYLQQALIFQGDGSEQEAAQELEQAVHAGLDHPAANFLVGFNLSKGERLESAQRYLERCFETSEYRLAARLLIAKTMRFKGNLNEATSNYLEALRIADSKIVPRDQSADMLRMYDPIIEAESKFTDPQVKNKLCDLVEEMLVRPGWQPHLAQMRGENQIDLEGAPAIPIGEVLTNPQGYRIIDSVSTINRYARSGYMRSAMEEAYFAIQFAPTYLPLHTYMGELLLKQEHLKEATEKFATIAQTYRARGETHHAIRVLERLIKAAPMDLDARQQLIALLDESALYNQAIQERVNLASVYYNLADLNKARKVYLDAYQLAQQRGLDRKLVVSILHNLADIEIQSLDWKHAVEIYEQIRKEKPDDFLASEKLVELNLRLGDDRQAAVDLEEYLSTRIISDDADAALAMLESLVAEYPTKTFVRNQKAEWHLNKAETEAAIHEFDALGEMLLDAGDVEGAKQAIQAILDLDPPNKLEYQELIDSLDTGESPPPAN
ncbi:MAG: tetratricopeptide repeat protein [Chloroflexota bacterium]|nr:MAG: tetratricopeptide repeat protein [Chloroflexota bacterium]